MYWYIWLALLVLTAIITFAATYRLAWWRIARRAMRRGRGIGYEDGYKAGYVQAMTDRRKRQTYQELWKEGMLN